MKNKKRIEYFKNKFETMSNDFVSLLHDNYYEYHNLFTRLIKGEENTVQVKEETCCRI